LSANILVAEDNELNFELVHDVLEAAGHLVTRASDGLEAVSLAAERDFDLLLLDLHMPRLDGADVLRRLRSEPQTRLLKIVVLTADAMRGTDEAVLLAGADAYLSKPFDVDALRSMVVHLLS